MGNMQGTQERRPEPQLLCWDEKKRPGLELGWKRDGGDSVAAFLPHPGITSRPWVLPPIYPDSLGFHLLSRFWPQWLCLLPLLWFFSFFFFFFGILWYSFFGFLWYPCFLFGLTYFPLTDSGLAHIFRTSPNFRGGGEGVHRGSELGVIESLA